jgi:phosphoribosylformimino-5-aminoimidazole carboxamide ribotide isomerase
MIFQIFPAVDILDGRCVQLVQGDPDTATVYGEPLRCAHRWIAEGADALHVVNLDGAFGNAGKNVELIRALICETAVTIQLGGGIRSVDDATSWLELGVERVILGTLAVRDPACIGVIAEEFGSDRVMASVDARGENVVVRGWQESAGEFLEWAKQFEALGAGSLLYTNVDVEGLQRGIQREPVLRLLERTCIPVVVAGGISSVLDVVALKKIGVAGIVLGSALYSGKIKLKDALEVRE